MNQCSPIRDYNADFRCYGIPPHVLDRCNERNALPLATTHTVLVLYIAALISNRIALDVAFQYQKKTRTESIYAW